MSMPMLDPVMHDAERLALELAELEERKRVSISFDVRDPDFHRLIPRHVTVERVAAGFLNAEGPVWMGDHLLLTDSPRNRIVRWQEGPGGFEVTTFRYPAGQPLDQPITQGQPGANGMTLDRAGRLLACEHGNRRVTRTELDGTITVVADRYQGKRLNRPNDVVVRSDGTVYFTDPPLRLPTPTEPRELEVAGVFRVAPDGTVCRRASCWASVVSVSRRSSIAYSLVRPGGRDPSPTRRRGGPLIHRARPRRRHIRGVARFPPPPIG